MSYLRNVNSILGLNTLKKYCYVKKRNAQRRFQYLPISANQLWYPEVNLCFLQDILSSESPKFWQKYNLVVSRCRILGVLFSVNYAKYCIGNCYYHGQYKRENEYKRASKTSTRWGKERLWKKNPVFLCSVPTITLETDGLQKGSVLRKTKNGLWWTDKPFPSASLPGILSIAQSI